MSSDPTCPFVACSVCISAFWL